MASKHFVRLPTVLLVAVGVAACDLLLPELPTDADVLDGPIEGLTQTQLAVFITGDEAFGKAHSPADGLGPTFVATACAQCHVGDGKGHPVFALTRFGRDVGDGFDPMVAQGGPQLQNRALPGHTPEVVPAGTTGVSKLLAPSVTGLGYLEAVDDATLIALTDPDDLDGDGISGRLQLVDASTTISGIAELEVLVLGEPASRGTLVDGKYIGRFGRKASAINLLHQTVNAYLQDMGLTTQFHPRDLLNAGTGNFVEDGAPDPEISSATLNAVVFYLKTLRVPPRRDREAADVRAGESLFAELGCTSCHLPSLQTGWSEVPQISQTTIHPYSDLLLHDMGPELDDGYTEGRAATSEWRTTPLWGVGLSASLQGGQAFYMHDGRATTFGQAIELHGGEGSRSRDAFRGLSEEDREHLFAFLRSL